MAEFFHARRLQYQILAQIENRWQVVDVVGDQREGLGRSFDRADFERLEGKVMSAARLVLAGPGVKAVKVLRERIRDDGFALEEEILFIEGSSAGPAQRTITGYAGAVPVCSEANDLLERPALRVIGLIMRPFLDRQNLLPAELVTLKATSRAIQREEKPLYDALNAAARQQAAELGVPVRQRADALDTVFAAARQRLRDAERLPSPPELAPRSGAAGLETYLNALSRRIETAARRFWALRGLCKVTDGGTSYGAKLEILLGFAGSALGAEGWDLIDELISGALDQPELVRELLGRREDLAEALFTIAALAQGVAPVGPGVPDSAAPLAAAIAARRLPKSAGALWDRLVRSLDGKQRLAHGTADDDWAAVMRLEKDLLPILPAEIQVPARDALAKRTTGLRAQLLENG